MVTFCGGRIAHRHWQHAIYHGFTAIWQTTYGQLLLLKCALVVLMVAIALTNRYVLVPRMRQENPRTDLWFVRMTQIEWGVGGIVLAIVSLFATLEPF